MSFSLFTAAQGASYSACLRNAGTTAAMLACINTEYRRVSTLLTTVYHKFGCSHAMVSAAAAPELSPNAARPSGSVVNAT